MAHRLRARTQQNLRWERRCRQRQDPHSQNLGARLRCCKQERPRTRAHNRTASVTRCTVRRHLPKHEHVHAGQLQAKMSGAVPEHAMKQLQRLFAPITSLCRNPVADQRSGWREKVSDGTAESRANLIVPALLVKRSVSHTSDSDLACSGGWGSPVMRSLTDKAMSRNTPKHARTSSAARAPCLQQYARNSDVVRPRPASSPDSRRAVGPETLRKWHSVDSTSRGDKARKPATIWLCRLSVIIVIMALCTGRRSPIDKAVPTHKELNRSWRTRKTARVNSVRRSLAGAGVLLVVKNVPYVLSSCQP